MVGSLKHYRQQGLGRFIEVSGPPVLLVHGFGTSFTATWRHTGWVDLLEDAGRSVVGVDLLGHGSGPRPTEPREYVDLEDHVLAAMPEEPVDAVGFSAGAMVVLWLAAHHPARFNRIVVAGVGANLFNSDTGRSNALVEAVRSGSASDPELRYFADLPEASSGQPNARAALVAFLERPDRRMFTTELLGRVTVPVLVVLGDRDFAGPATPLVEALPNASSCELVGIDHFATPKNFGFIDAGLKFLGAEPT